MKKTRQRSTLVWSSIQLSGCFFLLVQPFSPSLPSRLPLYLTHSAAEPLITATKLFSLSPGNEPSCLLQSRPRINWLCFTTKKTSIFIIVGAVKYHQHSRDGLYSFKATIFWGKEEKLNLSSNNCAENPGLFERH